jgi:hypothetical protein
MAWMTVPRCPRSQLHAKFHILGLEVVQYSDANMLQCPYSVLTLCGRPQYFQEGWGKRSEWVKWHGWQYQAVQDPSYMTISTFWGWRLCCIAMQTCYSTLTVSLHCVDNLSTIQNGWGKSSEWVKWHGWQYQAVQDPTYLPNFTFWGWRWCLIAMRMCSVFTLYGWPQYYPR